MNPYRVALVLCRAVTFCLWWSAALTALGAVLFALAFGGGFWVTLVSGGLGTGVTLAMAAIFLQVFAPSLVAAMLGNSALEGDAIAARRPWEHQEIALARAGAGVFLLFFGASRALPLMAAGGYALLTGQTLYGAAGPMSGPYFLASNALPPVLQCAIGLLLAFGAGLRRLVKPN